MKGAVTAFPAFSVGRTLGGTRRQSFTIESGALSQHPRPVSHLALARKVFDIELAALQAVRAQLDDSFSQAVEILVAALRDRSKIIVVGIGKSGNVGQKICATLTSTGSTCVVLSPVDALHRVLGIVNDGRNC